MVCTVQWPLCVGRHVNNVYYTHFPCLGGLNSFKLLPFVGKKRSILKKMDTMSVVLKAPPPLSHLLSMVKCFSHSPSPYLPPPHIPSPSLPLAFVCGVSNTVVFHYCTPYAMCSICIKECPESTTSV